MSFRIVFGLAASCYVSPSILAAPGEIASVELSRWHKGEATRSFAPGDKTFHATVRLAAPSSGDVVKAVWVMADVGGVKNYRFAEKAVATKAMDTLHFAATFGRPWPRGKYRLDVFLNGKRARQEYFAVR